MDNGLVILMGTWKILSVVLQKYVREQEDGFIINAFISADMDQMVCIANNTQR